MRLIAFILILAHSFTNGAGAQSDSKGFASPPVESPYAKWRNGPSADPDFFPIAVWLQNPRKASAYKAAGINTYVGLWKGPNEEQIAALNEGGMRVVCAQNDVGRRLLPPAHQPPGPLRP